MNRTQLQKILDAASNEVRSWPEWMQRPENRQRQPQGNKIIESKPRKKACSEDSKPDDSI